MPPNRVYPVIRHVTWPLCQESSLHITGDLHCEGRGTVGVKGTAGVEVGVDCIVEGTLIVT